MKLIILLILAAAISSCVSCSIHPVLLTPQQVIDSSEPKEAETIAVLDVKLRKARQALVLLMKEGQIDEQTADMISGQTRAVDYYITKAWAAMVEGDTRMRDEATLMAQAGYEAIYKNLMKVIDAIEKTGI